jgi:hypothetical protein
VSTVARTHQELIERARAADRIGAADARLWESLASVADYLRRIVDHGDSRHYRADKAGELVASALRVQRDAMADLAGDLDDPWIERLYDLHHLADNLTTGLTAAMWSATQGRELFTWQTTDLRRAVDDLRRCVNRLCDQAIPDPGGEG